MHYLDGRMSKGFTSLLISRLLLFIVAGFLGIFAPIFVYLLLQESVALSLLYFGVGALLFAFILPFGMRGVNILGFKWALVVSAFIGALDHYVFYITERGALPVSAFLITTIILLTLYRITYWVPFHTEFAKFSDKKNRGRQVSLFSAVAMLIGIFLPTVSALLIQTFGFEVVFLLAVILMVVSVVPYFFMPPLTEQFTWSVRQTWREFKARRKSKVAIAFMAEGAEHMIALIVWPIFLYQLFEGNFFEVGAVSTLIIGAAAIVQLLVGRNIDRLHQADVSLKWGSILYAIGWVVKIFVATAFQVFVVGVYHTISKIFTETPAHSLFYDMSSVNAEYVDEFTVLKEMFVNVGRFGGAMVAIILSMFVSVPWIFIIGALSALTFHFISNRDFDLKRCM